MLYPRNQPLYTALSLSPKHLITTKICLCNWKFLVFDFFINCSILISYLLILKYQYSRLTQNPNLRSKEPQDEAILKVLDGVTSRKMEESQIDQERKEDGEKDMLEEEEDGTFLTSQCSVCTGPAADHRHYGAVSCYSCR